MASEQIVSLVSRLEKGLAKTRQIFEPFTPDQWQQVIYEQPYPWKMRDLLAHFVSAEERLLELGKEVAQGGEGTPLDFDFDEFNRLELQRLESVSVQELLSMLVAARQTTLKWVASLEVSHLQKTGRHPVLGDVNLETMITAIYGHQLMHMRDVLSRFGKGDQ